MIDFYEKCVIKLLLSNEQDWEWFAGEPMHTAELWYNSILRNIKG